MEAKGERRADRWQGTTQMVGHQMTPPTPSAAPRMQRKYRSKGFGLSCTLGRQGLSVAQQGCVQPPPQPHQLLTGLSLGQVQ